MPHILSVFVLGRDGVRCRAIQKLVQSGTWAVLGDQDRFGSREEDVEVPQPCAQDRPSGSSPTATAHQAREKGAEPVR
jgi:hypothetical protein